MKIKMLTLAIATAATTTFTAPKAEAFGLINILVTGNLDYVGKPQTGLDILATTLCIALLPICLLDETAEGHVTTQNLVENGYTNEEAAEVVKGQSAFVQYLSDRQMAVVRNNSMSKNQFIEFVSNIPGVTPEYTQFLSQGL